MNDGEPTDLTLARERAEAARANCRTAIDDVLGWLSPDRLKAEAAMAATQQIDEAKAALRRQIGNHPLIAWSALAAVAGLATYILRRPLAALARSVVEAGRTIHHRIDRLIRGKA